MKCETQIAKYYTNYDCLHFESLLLQGAIYQIMQPSIMGARIKDDLNFPKDGFLICKFHSWLTKTCFIECSEECSRS